MWIGFAGNSEQIAKQSTQQDNKTLRRSNTPAWLLVCLVVFLLYHYLGCRSKIWEINLHLLTSGKKHCCNHGTGLEIHSEVSPWAENMNLTYEVHRTWGKKWALQKNKVLRMPWYLFGHGYTCIAHVRFRYVRQNEYILIIMLGYILI